jgi:hypothetical protein
VIVIPTPTLYAPRWFEGYSFRRKVRLNRTLSMQTEIRLVCPLERAARSNTSLNGAPLLNCIFMLTKQHTKIRQTLQQEICRERKCRFLDNRIIRRWGLTQTCRKPVHDRRKNAPQRLRSLQDPAALPHHHSTLRVPVVGAESHRLSRAHALQPPLTHCP